MCSLSSAKRLRKRSILSLSVMSVVINFLSSSAPFYIVWIFPNLPRTYSKLFLKVNSSCWYCWLDCTDICDAANVVLEF